MARVIGKIISHYKILEKFGESRIGVVHTAMDTESKRDVGLKVLYPHSTGGKKELLRLRSSSNGRRECQTTAEGLTMRRFFDARTHFKHTGSRTSML